MALESLHKIFPLIDDPANIFYSKIKQWFQLQSNFHLHCKAISRVDREVEANFMGISRIYKCKFKTYKVLTEDDIDKYLYIRYTFIASKKDNFELTSSGERIPVDISDLYILEDSPKPVVLGDHTETVLYEPIIKDPPYEKQHYYVYIRVNKIYKNEYSLLDIENTEIAYEELHFDDVYHPSIGRLWCIKKRDSVDATKKSVLDKNYEWKLYNIDSDDTYSLMDSDACIPESFGTNVIWSAQYGPGLDHKASFTCTYKDDGVDAEPPSELTTDFNFWIEIRETEWAVDTSKGKWACIDSTAEPYLNTRGVVPAFFQYLFNGLHFNVSEANSNKDIVEFLILLLSYVCNMNIRYLLCGLNQSPLYEVVNSSSEDTVDSLLATGGDPTKSMLGVYSVTFTPHNPSDLSPTNYDKVTYTKNSSNTTATYSNHKLVEDARNRITTDSLTHNNLPVPILPQIKWYIHQWVYALSFKKYSTRTLGFKNQRTAIFFQETAFSIFKELEIGFINANFVRSSVY